MNNHIKLLSLSLLTGCASYPETFECGVGPGVGCQSLSAVNTMIEQGQLPSSPAPSTLHKKIVSKGHTVLLPKEPVVTGRRVWMAAHEDEEGYYHEDTYIRLQPVQKRQDP